MRPHDDDLRCARRARSRAVAALMVALTVGCHGRPVAPDPAPVAGRRLTHEETLAWIASHRAWREARKTKPMWARAVEPAEVGKEFHTADHAVERADADHWLCVGVAGEPWFQPKAKIEAKYRCTVRERRQFSFDDAPHEYGVFHPREGSRSWAAKIDDPAIEGFYIQPSYPTDGPLYSPRGGYVVRDHIADPYAGSPNDVWLVQQALFESTYELD